MTARSSQMSARSNRSRWVASGVLAVIVAGGFALRITNLGGPDFADDEILHVFAAQELWEGNSPLLPSGTEYRRSLAYTGIVAVSTGLLGVSEWSARLPSVLFGTLSIVLVFAMTQRWYSSSAALLAAFLTAVAPMEIAFSRQVRMYAMFQLCYLAFLFLFFEGFESAPASRVAQGLRRRLADLLTYLEVRPLLLFASFLVLGLATHLHTLTLAGTTGPMVYVVVMAVVAGVSPAMPPGLRLKYVTSVAAAVLALALASALTSLVSYAVFMAGYVPSWAGRSAGEWRYYIWMLMEFHPSVFGLYALAVVFAVTRNAKTTLYLAACFTVPVVLHSVFAWKSGRYIFHVLPLLFIIGGVALSGAMAWVGEVVAGRGAALVGERWARRLAPALSLAACAFFLASSSEFREGIDLYRLNEGEFAGIEHRNWQGATAFIEKHGGPGDVIVTHAPGLARYYAPARALFCVNGNTLNDTLSVLPVHDELGRALENVAGVPIVDDLEALKDVVARHPSGWFMAERGRFESASVVPVEIQRYVRDTFAREETPLAPDIVLWRWSRDVAVREAQ